MITQRTLRKYWALVLALPIATALLLGGAPAGATEKADSSTPDVAANDWHQIMPNLVVGGSLRLRAEEQANFRFGSGAPSDDESYTLHRLRVNMKWTPTESLTFFIEGQDAEIHHENDINDEAIPNLYADHFDLYQGYVEYRSSMMDTPYTVRAGRQQLNLGSDRLASSRDWENTSRVFDAIRVSLGTEDDWTLDLFASRVVPVRPGNFDDWEYTGSRYVDSNFHGAYYTNWKLLPDTKWEGYLLLRHNNDVNDKVWTLGSRGVWAKGLWDADLEIAYQWGDFANVDHAAWMTHIGFGYHPEWMENTRFGLAYNWATGDDNPLDTDHETFDNLFASNHRYYGQMDFFSLQNMRSLAFTFEKEMLEKGMLEVAFHTFWIDEPDDDFMYDSNLVPRRLAGALGADSSAGNELDITFRYPFLDGRVVALVGYGHYFAGDYIDDTGLQDDAADFAFIQADIQF